jgi:3-oxoacyl-[acyl-carrier protein] reductase
MSLLSGKVAAITGGSRGIGLATARAMLKHGASVVFTATSDESVARAVADLQNDAPADRILGLKADVRKYSNVESAWSAAATRFGGLDIVVNNAGIGMFRPVAEMAIDEWRDVFETNVTGVFNGSRAAISHLRKRGGGWIINISSLASKNPFVNGAAYCATKAAVNAFSEALMQEVRYEGIRVAYVLPGSVNTGFGGLANTKSDGALAPDDVAQVIVDLVAHPSRALPSRVEIRPAQPPRKG